MRLASSRWRLRRGRSAPVAPGSGDSPAGGEPRTTEEKIDDVAALDALTAEQPGDLAPRPLGRPRADPDGLRQYAEERSIGFDAMNSNTFQDNPSTTGDGALSYKFGSLANADPAVREVGGRAQPTRDRPRACDSGRRRSRCGWPTGSTIPGRPITAPSSSGSPTGSQAIHDHLPDGLADVHRAQAVRARLLRHGQPRLGVVAAAGAGGRCQGRLASSTSGTTSPTPTSSRSSAGSPWSAGSAGSTSTTPSTATTTSPPGRSGRSSSS